MTSRARRPGNELEVLDRKRAVDILWLGIRKPLA